MLKENGYIQSVNYKKPEVKPELKDKNCEMQGNPTKLRKQGTNKNKLHMYQNTKTKSKNQTKIPREKNHMYAKLSHATQNYDLNIGQNQPAVSKRNILSPQSVRSQHKNELCCEVKHSNKQYNDQTQKFKLELLAWTVIKIITLCQIKIIVQNLCSRNKIPWHSFEEKSVSIQSIENVQLEASNQKESTKTKQSVLIKKHKNQRPLTSIYKNYDLCYLYELHRIKKSKYFHPPRVKIKILEKILRYCAKYHDTVQPRLTRRYFPNSFSLSWICSVSRITRYCSLF